MGEISRSEEEPQKEIKDAESIAELCDILKRTEKIIDEDGQELDSWKVAGEIANASYQTSKGRAIKIEFPTAEIKKKVFQLWDEGKF